MAAPRRGPGAWGSTRTRVPAPRVYSTQRPSAAPATSTSAWAQAATTVTGALWPRSTSAGRSGSGPGPPPAVGPRNTRTAPSDAPTTRTPASCARQVKLTPGGDACAMRSTGRGRLRWSRPKARTVPSLHPPVSRPPMSGAAATRWVAATRVELPRGREPEDSGALQPAARTGPRLSLLTWPDVPSVASSAGTGANDDLLAAPPAARMHGTLNVSSRPWSSTEQRATPEATAPPPAP